MATVQEELNYLEETKSLIKQVIINKGQDISNNTPFRNYVNKINDIDTLNPQAKTITPRTSQQVITPDQNYNALSQVTIEAVTSNIDSNIEAGNIRSGISILGIIGNYVGSAMKEYNSETAMNNDIANISEGEVVKVVASGVTTFYLKETTMKKLVKEESTISPQEYEENIDLVNDILGEEE